MSAKRKPPQFRVSLNSKWRIMEPRYYRSLLGAERAARAIVAEDFYPTPRQADTATIAYRKIADGAVGEFADIAIVDRFGVHEHASHGLAP